MKRKEGIYKVKNNGKWMLARWTEYMSEWEWFLFGDEVGWPDDGFEEIDETLVTIFAPDGSLITE